MLWRAPRCTRWRCGAVCRSQSVTLRVVGGVVPASVTAVAVNVTVTEPRAAGWVSVGPAPTSSSSNLRSEEHTSELQSQSNLVCRLLLEKKNNGSPGTVHLVADLQGYFTQAGPGSVVLPLGAVRL